MNVRPFTEADRPFLRTLFLASRKANWHWLDGSDWALEDFDRVTLGERILVAEDDGHRLGFAAVLPNDNFLHSLFIDPDWQGKRGQPAADRRAGGVHLHRRVEMHEGQSSCCGLLSTAWLDDNF